MRLSKPALVLVTVLAVAAPATAAVDVFLKIPGVPGHSTDVKHSGWIDVSSQSLAIAQPVAEKQNDIQKQCAASFATSLGAGIASAVQLVGAPLPGDVLVEHVNAGTNQVIAEIKLQGAVIVSMASSQPNATESLALNFSRIEYKTYVQRADGTMGDPSTGVYDCRSK
ncbi:MAG TPA: hypothetical protein VFV54_08870 [Thermoanaerobaculia bacterium]|nr:hypothetical protein [Thermoanaerobaculia bacterium]